jgi:uncharacterized protein YxeA
MMEEYLIITAENRFSISVVAALFSILALLIAAIGIGQYYNQNYPNENELIKITGIPEKPEVKQFHSETFRAKLNNISTDGKINIDKNSVYISYSDSSYNPNYFGVKRAVSQGETVTVTLDARKINNGKLRDSNIYELEKDGKVILECRNRIQAKRKNSRLGLILGIVFGVLGGIIITGIVYLYFSPAISQKKTKTR